MQPLVTVLMPVYNAEAFLRDAVESILQQTFTDFEFLIIDDGSSDNSVAIIQSYTDPRIRFIQNEKNLGISATLNRGLEVAACELVTRMDADDISHPTRLQQQFDFFETHKDVALLSTQAREISETGDVMRIEKWRRPFFYYNLTFECWIYHPTVMYRRSAVLDVGGYSTPYSEDYDLWWQLSRKFKMDHLPEVLVDYRLTAVSLYRATKKTEYEKAQYDQIMRNLHFYTGATFSISHAELECYRHNFAPILAEKKTGALVRAVRKLDHINYCILQKENVNRDVADITEAAYEKKKFIINQLLAALPKHQKLDFLLRLGHWRKLLSGLKSFSV